MLQGSRSDFDMKPENTWTLPPSATFRVHTLQLWCWQSRLRATPDALVLAPPLLHECPTTAIAQLVT